MCIHLNPRTFFLSSPQTEFYFWEELSHQMPLAVAVCSSHPGAELRLQHPGVQWEYRDQGGVSELRDSWMGALTSVRAEIILELAFCNLKDWLNKASIKCSYQIYSEDTDYSKVLRTFLKPEKKVLNFSGQN